MGRQDYERTNNEFVNPYNFVKVDWNNTKRKDINKQSSEDNLVSGVLHCHLLTRAPVAIPGDVIDISNDTQKHKTYDFMRDIYGNPMIPGSSIRGVIRNVFEALTDSCFCTSKENMNISKRNSPNNPFEPGVIKKENGVWKLYKAERFRVRVNKNGKTRYGEYYEKKDLIKIGMGRIVEFNYIVRDTETKKGKKIENKYVTAINGLNVVNKDHNFRKGFLYIGESIYNKTYESIFAIEKNGFMYDVGENAIETIKYLLKEYNNTSVNNNAKKDDKKAIYNSLYKVIDSNEDIIPIWFKKSNEEKNVYTFSLAAIGRIKYNITLGELLYEKKKCKNKKELCEACSLFGMTGENCVGSRIRFTDATVREGDKVKVTEPVLLKELSSPKISYIPFYANSIMPYDYDAKGITLRGRKFYWHNLIEDVYKDKNRTNRNETMRLLDKNQRLYFDVYYDNITKEELEKLEWALIIYENKEESDYCHKIGHGKPIGLGSVKIVIDNDYRKMYSDNNYEVKAYTIDRLENVNFDLIRTEEIKRILNIKALQDKKISYPYIEKNESKDVKHNDNNVAAHQWFTKVWQFGQAGDLEQHLSSINDITLNDKVLYSYRYKKKEKQYKKQKKW